MKPKCHFLLISRRRFLRWRALTIYVALGRHRRRSDINGLDFYRWLCLLLWDVFFSWWRRQFLISGWINVGEEVALKGIVCRNESGRQCGVRQRWCLHLGWRCIIWMKKPERPTRLIRTGHPPSVFCFFVFFHICPALFPVFSYSPLIGLGAHLKKRLILCSDYVHP